MIKQQQIHNLIEGKQNNQLVTAIVQSSMAVIPTVVLNVYLNMNMKFLQMHEVVMEQKKSNLTLHNAPKTQPIALMQFYFTTNKKNYERYFGPYAPGKILQFDFTGVSKNA